MPHRTHPSSVTPFALRPALLSNPPCRHADKLGEAVRPDDGQPGGAMHMHGIGAGIGAAKPGCGATCTLFVRSIDAGLAVFGEAGKMECYYLSFNSR